MKYSQRNIEQLFRLIGSFPNQEYGQTDHFEYIRTTDSIWPNQLINLKVSENEIETVLDVIEKNSEDGKIPNLLMLKPSTKDFTLINNLRQRDYKSRVWYAMTHNLEVITIRKTNYDFRAIQVQDKNDFKEWRLIVEEELMENNSLNPVVFTSLLENTNCYFFLGFERKQPVSTSFLFVNENTAGVYLVSTKKSHRKKGFGQEMTNQCLLKAKELECKNVELQATELGKNVYITLGFIEQGAIDVFRIKKTSHNKTSKQ